MNREAGNDLPARHTVHSRTYSPLFSRHSSHTYIQYLILSLSHARCSFMKLIKSFWRKRFFETRWRSRTLRTVDKGYIKEKWDKKFSSIKTKEGYRKNGIHLTNLLRELRVLQSLIKLSHFIYFLYPSKNILPSFTQNFYSVYVVLLWRLCMQGMRTIKRTYLSLFSLGTARVQQF